MASQKLNQCYKGEVSGKILTSYHLSIATDLKCHRDAGIHVEKYDILMRLWALRMRWTVVLMFKAGPKMEHWLDNRP